MRSPKSMKDDPLMWMFAALFVFAVMLMALLIYGMLFFR